ncbi:MAG: hypothetical protein FWC41_00915 [Firmicutes bacterium]|nr:hypothetical protein [Bacillota bacterium]
MNRTLEIYKPSPEPSTILSDLSKPTDCAVVMTLSIDNMIVFDKIKRLS